MTPLIELIGALDGAAEVLVRPHPADPQPAYVTEGSRHRVVEGGAIEGFLGRCDLVIMIGYSAVTWSAARLAVPAFEIHAVDRVAALLDLGDGPGDELRHIDDLLSLLDVVDLPSRDSCPEGSHPVPISTEEFLGILESDPVKSSSRGRIGARS